MVLLANSTNLAMLYLSLELVSLTSYIMVGYLKTDRLSNEASLKYILFGAISTGSMLYGLSLIYGMTGSLNLYTIRDAFLSQGVEGCRPVHRSLNTGLDDGRVRIQDRRCSISFLVPGCLRRGSRLLSRLFCPWRPKPQALPC